MDEFRTTPDVVTITNTALEYRSRDDNCGLIVFGLKNLVAKRASGRIDESYSKLFHGAA
jgi:hypothetical protein